MATNAELTNEYFQIMNERDGDIAGRRQAFAYMKESTAIVHHQVVACSYVPRLFNRETHDAMATCAETAHRILCKVMQRYLDDPEYRTIFDFDPRLQDLILIPRRYDALLPFARVDTFMNEDDYTFKFCEFNGDGSSGMNENREITHSIENTPAYQEMAARHNLVPCELFDAWVSEFISIYDTFENKVEHPRFAIVDYLENGVVDEFKIFSQLFAEKGYPCAPVDVRDLHFDGQVLTDAQGNRVDAIWRRCVTNDVIEHWDESQELIEAVRAGAVALIGSFAGHIVHDKQIFKALFDPATQAFLTEEERQFVQDTVPRTVFLNSNDIDLEEIKANKDQWIIKPTDAYGAKDVYAGCYLTQEQWDDTISRFADEKTGFPFLAQTYITPFKTLTLPPDANIEEQSDEDVPRQGAWYNNLNGLYLYNGHFQGVFSRLGPLPTISKDMQGITSATIWVED
ncbi:MAG: circularly permuted type 2 ATP-grasp protein [Eggerthellales bacterium]|nr:circularly permuted type 2 ATP-grasp protein [Eggerthellales bacterium]